MTPHRYYVEPLAGSAAVLFAKAPAHYEVINDIDGEVVNLFRVLRDHGDDLAARLELTPYAREEYLASHTIGVDTVDDPVERARIFMIRACMGFNGKPGVKAGYGFSTPRYRKSYTFARRIDGLSEIVERLRHVEVENMDAVALLDRYNVEDATVYADPPYVAHTRVAPSAYGIEAGDLDFHATLLKRLDGFAGEVLISGYDCELYRDLLPRDRWTLLTREVQCPTSNADGGSRRVESLWIKRRETDLQGGH